MKKRKTLLKRGLAIVLTLAMVLTGQLPRNTVNTAKAGSDDEKQNVALLAKADAKSTNIYGGVSTDRINDGELAGAVAGTSWNCWGTDEYPMWVTLTWDGIYTLSGMSILWWTYNDGGVVVHELCHRKQMNHSKDFWREVEKVLPDYRKQVKWLKNEGSNVMRRMGIL